MHLVRVVTPDSSVEMRCDELHVFLAEDPLKSFCAYLNENSFISCIVVYGKYDKIEVW